MLVRERVVDGSSWKDPCCATRERGIDKSTEAGARGGVGTRGAHGRTERREGKRIVKRKRKQSGKRKRKKKEKKKGEVVVCVCRQIGRGSAIIGGEKER